MSGVVDYLTRWTFRRPKVLLAITGIAQRIKPLFTLGKTTVVLRAVDVRDVFSRADIFELGPIGEGKMLSGKFLLGMDHWPICVQDKAHLQEILCVCERDHLEAIVEKHCKVGLAKLQEVIDERTGPDGGRAAEFDLVKEFAEPTVTRIAAEFFLGIQELQGLHSEVVDAQANSFMTSDEKIFARWLRYVGSVIATAEPAPFGLHSIASASADEMSAWLTDVCTRELANIESDDADNGAAPILQKDSQSDECLERFARYRSVVNGIVRNCRDYPYRDDDPLAGDRTTSGRAGKNEEIIKRSQRNIAGLLLAGSTPLIHSIASAIDQLLIHSDVWTGDIPMMSPMSELLDLDFSISPHMNSDDVSDVIGPDIEETPDHSSVKGVAHRYARISHFIEAIRKHIRELEEDIATLSADVRPDPGAQLEQVKAKLSGALDWRARIEQQMDHVVYEAMRFNPTFPFLARHCPRHDVVGTVADDAVEVPAGRTIVASQLSAMHDTTFVPNADTFAYRALHTYMHFGYGGHGCLGRDIATKIMTQAVLQLLQIAEIEGAEQGKFGFDGPAVSSYVVKLNTVKERSS